MKFFNHHEVNLMKVMKFGVELFSFLHELHALHGKIVFSFLNHPFA